MRKKLFGALIGFALGFYVASTLLTTIFCTKSFATNLDIGGLIVVYSSIITGFSFFGVHCMSDKDHSENRWK